MLVIANFSMALRDVALAWQRRELWLRLGWKDIRLRFSRTILGPFWQTISIAVFVSALGFVFVNFWHTTIAVYLPFLTAGVIVWNFITFSFTEGCSTFIGATGFIKQAKIPLTVYAFQVVYRNVIVMLHSFPVIVLIDLYFRTPPTLALSVLPISILLLAVNAYWLALLLGMLSARFRDIPNFIGNALTVIFFVTPIHWMPTQIGRGRMFIVNWNPFHHFIELVRGPLIGQWPSELSWLVCIGLTVVNGIAALYLYAHFRSRLVYWL